MKNECKCEFCGKTFFPTRRKEQKYCSADCRTQDYLNKISQQRKDNIEPKKCAICEKIFKPLHKSTKYCSEECAYEARKQKTIDFLQNKREIIRKTKGIQEKEKKHIQPCWSCVNACGNCSWSKWLEPVEGWEAEETMFREDAKIKFFLIKKCPEYKKGRALPMEI